MDLKKQIDQVLQGNSDSFELVVRHYEKKIFTFCFFMLGNRQEAEDAAQEVFFKAYRNLAGYRHDNDNLFLAWLYKIASNHCNTLLKRKKRWHHLMLLFGNRNDEKSAEQTFAEQSENQLQWLEGLSPAEKQLLALRVIEDRSFQEISDILGIRAAAVRKRFERIKVKLRRNREQWEGMCYEQRYEYKSLRS